MDKHTRRYTFFSLVQRFKGKRRSPKGIWQLQSHLSSLLMPLHPSCRFAIHARVFKYCTHSTLILSLFFHRNKVLASASTFDESPSTTVGVMKFFKVRTGRSSTTSNQLISWFPWMFHDCMTVIIISDVGLKLTKST